jgi:hypothetical protein
VHRVPSLSAMDRRVVQQSMLVQNGHAAGGGRVTISCAARGSFTPVTTSVDGKTLTVTFGATADRGRRRRAWMLAAAG